MVGEERKRFSIWVGGKGASKWVRETSLSGVLVSCFFCFNDDRTKGGERDCWQGIDRLEEGITEGELGSLSEDNGGGLAAQQLGSELFKR